MLTSGTTKWPGLVSNIDAAPTVVEAFGLDRGHMLGRGSDAGPDGYPGGGRGCQED